MKWVNFTLTCHPLWYRRSPLSWFSQGLLSNPWSQKPPAILGSYSRVTWLSHSSGLNHQHTTIHIAHLLWQIHWQHLPPLQTEKVNNRSLVHPNFNLKLLWQLYHTMMAVYHTMMAVYHTMMAVYHTMMAVYHTMMAVYHTMMAVYHTTMAVYHTMMAVYHTTINHSDKHRTSILY